MLNYLALLPTLPLVGFLILTAFGKSLSKRSVVAIGVGSMALAAMLTIGIAIHFLSAPPPGHVFEQHLWTWFQVGDLAPGFSLYLDALSLAMILVITLVGFLIHLYSAEFMRDDDAYARFFAYMNLFVSLMLILVLADNLLLLYLGWEGVGMCSFLLIGFWYKKPENSKAAQKAFIVTRVGDTAMAIGLFLLITQLGTLDIQELGVRASEKWPVGSGMAVAAAALLLGGAVGKSAQLPLQTWLPDAMAGPSPVSALIHAATMVTAGVYLIARTHALFALAPVVLTAVMLIGLLTQLTAGISAVHQRDIKRILAYSTISQLGYMFFALGVSSNGAAINHLMTHACFKATWFLAAGAVIIAVNHEHDIFKMGGLGKKLPVLFWTMFFAGCGPFFSKDGILAEVWFSDTGGPFLWLLGLFGVFVTSIYLFRLLFTVFLGPLKNDVHWKPGLAITIPLVILATGSVVGAIVEYPRLLGYHPYATGTEAAHASPYLHAAIGKIAVGVALAGIYVAYRLFVRHKHYEAGEVVVPHITLRMRRLFAAGWYFDRAYHAAFVVPFQATSRFLRSELIDRGYDAVVALVQTGHRQIRRSQTGRLRWYAAGIAVGAVFCLGAVLL
ncbi:MAG: NADH-quinone oxidoreductase subunit L [Planctomycetes bacterium]|nr:NADH-quinone oxidoreductase subunit L [Planctomycetota bacterium]